MARDEKIIHAAGLDRESIASVGSARTTGDDDSRDRKFRVRETTA